MPHKRSTVIYCGSEALSAHQEVNKQLVASGDAPLELIFDATLEPNKFWADVPPAADCEEME